MPRRCSRCGAAGHTKRTCERRETGEIATSFEWDVVLQQGDAIDRLRADVNSLQTELEFVVIENTMLWAWLHLAGLAEDENPPQRRTLASFSTSGTLG